MSASSARRSPRQKDPAPLFAALGDRTRLRLLGRLGGGGPQSIAQLTAGASVSRQAITKHLEVLSRAGVVHGLRRGRERIWKLNPARLADAHQVLDGISRQWDDALYRLKGFVEE